MRQINMYRPEDAVDMDYSWSEYVFITLPEEVVIRVPMEMITECHSAQLPLYIFVDEDQAVAEGYKDPFVLWFSHDDLTKVIQDHYENWEDPDNLH